MKSRRPGTSNLVPIATLLNQSQKKTQSAFTVIRLRRVWKEIVGDLLANQTKPKKVDRNILWVSVSNSALNYELSLMKPLILEKIQEVSGQKYKDVKLVHETVEAVSENNPGIIKQKFIRIPAHEEETLDSILNKVKTLSKDLQKKRTD